MPWTPEVLVLRDPGNYTVGDFHITNIRGKQRRSVGQGVRAEKHDLASRGERVVDRASGRQCPADQGNVRELGRVDILMMPIEAREHILERYEVQAIRHATARADPNALSSSGSGKL